MSIFLEDSSCSLYGHLHYKMPYISPSCLPKFDGLDHTLLSQSCDAGSNKLAILIDN